jgi:lipopolysaccharide export system permease protein
MLMQFLWKYVQDLVGKGVEMRVLAEMFFYVALYLIPTTLPLAILLASLMTFGNLGEHFELLAMKAAGVSLFRIMRPIVIFLIFISGASFLFQNNIVPVTQGKMWTMLSSIKNQKPELEIPEGSFFKGIPGYNVYVEHKDKTGGMMRDMKIYDFSRGFEKVSIILADSGKFKMSEDKLSLILTLQSGETFSNYEDKGDRHSPDEKIPYQRETFSRKESLVQFDSNFNMGDESFFQNREISKRINQLVEFLDSIKSVSDSIDVITKNEFRQRIYANTFREIPEYSTPIPGNASNAQDTITFTNWDDYFNSKDMEIQKNLIGRAKSRFESFRGEYNMDAFQQSERLIKIRRHETEIHQRFALAIACVLFFFIGAPLGAIVRKGGLGVPAVLSVVVFITYYTINMFGLKMARQEIWPVWQGLWLSTLFLVIPGAFLTYKAVNDSVMMNPDVWKDFFLRFFGKREVRNYQRKEVIITPPNYGKDMNDLQELTKKCTSYLENNNKWLRYSFFWKNGFKDNDLQSIINMEESIVEDLRNSSENLILGKLMDYPIIKPGYPEFLDITPVRVTCAILFPIGIGIYLISVYKRKYIKRDVKTIIKVNDDLTKELCSN